MSTVEKAAEKKQTSAATPEAEFGPILRYFAKRYFDDVRFIENSENQLKQLSEKGFVVHVMRTTAWVNYLYLSWSLLRRGLPPLRAVVNLRRWMTRPWRMAAQRGEPAVRFTYARRNGGAALIFIKRTAFGRAEGKELREDPFPSLVSIARREGAPVYLVPELFVWEKAGQRLQPSIVDYVFGSPDAPGFLHTVVAFWRNYRRAQFRVGEPIDLQSFIAQNPRSSDEIIARKVRGALSQHLARETRAVFGPPRKPTHRLIEETLRDRTLRRTLEHQAKALNRPLPGLERRARKDLQSIAAKPEPTVIGLIAPVLGWVFNRLYDGIEVDEAGLDRAMKAASRAPVVFCPSHKSHVDYLIMSFVLWTRGYSIPLVAAGSNLSFFPLGPFFRRGGAFFLRRSFKGDPIYSAVFRAYLKKLVRDGIHQEFFPEGGRSRTGKLLTPKLGMLTWEVEAVLEGARDDLHFIPVSIDYEKVVESHSYSRERAGGEKRPEDIRALLSAPKVLRSEYGRIHLTFDSPISLVEFMREREISHHPGSTEPDKRNLVRALAHRIMYGIERVSTITPQALVCAALLADRGPGVTPVDLAERINLLRRIATEEGRAISSTLRDAPSDPAVIGPVQDALAGFLAEGQVQSEQRGDESLLVPVKSRRSELSFHKNALMNLVAPQTLVANAVLALEAPAPIAETRQRALFLSRLFKFELIYQVGVEFDGLFADALDKLVRKGLVLSTNDLLSVAPEPHSRPQLAFIADLLRDYLETYLLAALALQDLAELGSMERKAFIEAAVDRGRQKLLSGRLDVPEALSRPAFENATLWLVDQGFLADEEKKLRLGPAGLTRESREALTQAISQYLRP
jgi:glycerol-3-phosphate O-acyltransferase